MATTLQVHRPGASQTPVWMVLLIFAMGAAMSGAAWLGGQWPLTVVVLLIVGAAFAVVVQQPHVGISVFLTTFLINYPGVARGTGYFTINNALGAMFLSLLAWDYYRTRDAWYLREPLIRVLLLIGLMMMIGTMLAELILPDAELRQMLVRKIGAKSAGVDYTERQLFQYFSRVAFVVFVVQFVRTPRQLRAVFITLLVCILVAIPPALMQYAQSGGGEEEFRLRATLVNWADNVNRFAFGCLIGIAMLFHFFNSARSPIARASSALGALLLLPLVVMAASRSGFLGLVVLAGLITVGFFGSRPGAASRGTGLAVVLGFAVIGVLTFFFVLGPQLQERILNINPFAERAGQQLEGASSAQQRAESAQESIALFKRSPLFGVGIGNFRWVNKYYHGSRWKPPHNSYLWAAAEGGIMLLGLYLFLFWKIFRELGHLRAAYRDRTDLRFFPNWLRAYLLLVLFFSFFADVWLEVHVFLLIAATILLRHWASAPPSGETVASRPASFRLQAPAPTGAV